MELCPCLNPQAHSIPVLLNAPTASLFIGVRNASAGACLHSTVQGITTPLRCASRFTGVPHTADRTLLRLLRVRRCRSRGEIPAQDGLLDS
jgi:hypothetical protein